MLSSAQRNLILGTILEMYISRSMACRPLNGLSDPRNVCPQKLDSFERVNIYSKIVFLELSYFHCSIRTNLKLLRI